MSQQYRATAPRKETPERKESETPNVERGIGFDNSAALDLMSEAAGTARGEGSSSWLSEQIGESGPTAPAAIEAPSPLETQGPAVEGPGTLSPSLPGLDGKGAVPMATPSGITVQNEFAAPGGGDARTKVGVNEKVWLTPEESGGAWAASGGKGKTLKDGAYEWRAPTAAGSYTVSYTPKGGTALVTTFEVVAPATMTATSATSRSYTGQGAGMDLELQIGPTSVSFAALQWKEIAGPATDIKGYFENKPADKLAHNPAGWRNIGDQNNVGDKAEFEGWPGPYKGGGSYTWSIPNRWRPDGSGEGTEFHTSTQVMSILDDAGNSTVTKFGKP